MLGRGCGATLNGTHGEGWLWVRSHIMPATRRELLHEHIRHVQTPAEFLADAPQAAPKPKESLQAAPQTAPKPKESPQAIILIKENKLIIFLYTAFIKYIAFLSKISEKRGST